MQKLQVLVYHMLKRLTMKKENLQLEAAKATLQATLEALNLEKEATAALAQAKVLEAAFKPEDGDICS